MNSRRKARTLSFRRADFQLIEDLLDETPWHSALGNREAARAGSSLERTGALFLLYKTESRAHAGRLTPGRLTPGRAAILPRRPRASPRARRPAPASRAASAAGPPPAAAPAPASPPPPGAAPAPALPGAGRRPRGLQVPACCALTPPAAGRSGAGRLRGGRRPRRHGVGGLHLRAHRLLRAHLPRRLLRILTGGERDGPGSAPVVLWGCRGPRSAERPRPGVRGNGWGPGGSGAGGPALRGGRKRVWGPHGPKNWCGARW